MVEDVDVKVQDVELVGQGPNPVEHDHVIRNMILDRRIQSQRDFAAGLQVSGGARVPAGEQRYIMPLSD